MEAESMDSIRDSEKGYLAEVTKRARDTNRRSRPGITAQSHHFCRRISSTEQQAASERLRSVVRHRRYESQPMRRAAGFAGET